MQKKGTLTMRERANMASSATGGLPRQILSVILERSLSVNLQGKGVTFPQIALSLTASAGAALPLYIGQYSVPALFAVFPGAVSVSAAAHLVAFSYRCCPLMLVDARNRAPGVGVQLSCGRHWNLD